MAPLTVNVKLFQTGRLRRWHTARPPLPSQPGQTWKADVTIPLDDDDVFEADGLLGVLVLQGAGYTPPYLLDYLGMANQLRYSRSMTMTFR